MGVKLIFNKNLLYIYYNVANINYSPFTTSQLLAHQLKIKICLAFFLNYKSIQFLLKNIGKNIIKC